MNEILTQAADIWAAIDWTHPGTTFAAAIVAGTIAGLTVLTMRRCVLSIGRRIFRWWLAKKRAAFNAGEKLSPYDKHKRDREPDNVLPRIKKKDPGGGKLSVKLTADTADFAKSLAKATTVTVKEAAAAMDAFGKAAGKVFSPAGVPSLNEYPHPPPPVAQGKPSISEFAQASKMACESNLTINECREMLNAGVVKHGLTMTKDDIEKLRQSWQDQYTGQILKLGEEVKFTPLPNPEPVVFEANQHLTHEAMDIMGKQLKEAYGGRRIVILPPGMRMAGGAGMKLPEGERFEPFQVGDLIQTETIILKSRATFYEPNSNAIDIVHCFDNWTGKEVSRPAINGRLGRGVDITNVNHFPVQVRYRYKMT